jgi:hyperosmotically inducible periplasmic protein
MRLRLAGIIASAAMALLLSGCNGETTNTNTTANANAANANANANVANSNTNQSANTNTNRAPTREEYERDKERYQREAKQSGRTIGTGLNDGWLWAKARFDLAAVDDLRDSTINVDVDNGVVTLTGTVASAAQRKKAEDTAKTIEGIKGVKNMLKVVPNPSANANANTNTPRK